MFRILNLQPEIFALDINDLSLMMAKLEKTRKGLLLVSFCSVDLPPGIVTEGVICDQEAFSRVISRAYVEIKGKKLGTKHVIVSLPEEKSFSQVIRMPTMTQEEMRLAVPLEAENYIPLSIDKTYWDFQLIPFHSAREKKADNHVHLLINVMPKAIIDTYVACVKKAGFVPEILEVESQAIARALIPKNAIVPPLIIIDFGRTKSSFIIFSGNSVRFTSSIPVSSGQLTQAIADALKVKIARAEELKIKYGWGDLEDKKYRISESMKPVLDELVAQIKKYVGFYYGHVSHEYFSSEGSIEKIILSGGGSNLKNLPEFLAKALNMPVEIGNPLTNIILPKRKKADAMSSQELLSFTTALGLAMRAVEKEHD